MIDGKKAGDCVWMAIAEHNIQFHAPKFWWRSGGFLVDDGIMSFKVQ